MDYRRYSRLTIAFHIWGVLKFFFFAFLYLFIFNREADWIGYGRIIAAILLILSIIFVIFKWLTTTYKIDEVAFYLREGFFTKHKRTIPFSKVQNVNRHTTFLHKLIGKTSLKFETGMSGDGGTIKFEVLSKEEADHLEDWIEKSTRNIKVSEGEEEKVEEYIEDRKLHFAASKKDIIKASMTSLSFLLLIPALGSLFFMINDFINVEKEAEGAIHFILSAWWLTALVVIFLVVASTIFGMIKTYIKYGNYRIYSDVDRIYISRGVLDEVSFSISKEKVQAVEITQTLMKRILRIAEVKLTSAGQTGGGGGDSSMETSSLFPFLPQKDAFRLISEILPDYEVEEEMHKLPKNALFARLLKPSWLWMIATALLYYFQPNVLNMNMPWWLFSLLLLILVVLLRVLDYYNSRYVLNERFIQLKTGSLATTLFLTRRDKVIEIEMNRGPLEKLLGIAKITTINRAQPVRHTHMYGVPESFRLAFYQWYKKRGSEIEFKQ
ncbi:PH domain-containing protein [Cytobacillus kochii]|uniref:PH domain-containing protein n=1 Tax=Cytobacillus kochii TaxID=859143 RepID=UPI001CD3EF23|nr:PH domain-containing protein [Cytobacillus kochii]MCA1024503.1 PH domain-containing protein [Cytobacillus kochii]